MLRLPEWSERLDRADSADEVIALVRDFLARLTPAELEDLPTEGKPGRLASPAAIHEYALWLSQAELKLGHFAPLMLHVMARFFSAAAQRLAYISRFPPLKMRAKERS
jgi:hypothetical protein